MEYWLGFPGRGRSSIDTVTRRVWARVEEWLGFPGRGQGPAPERWAVGPVQSEVDSEVCSPRPLPAEGGPYIPEHSLRQGVFLRSFEEL